MSLGLFWLPNNTNSILYRYSVTIFYILSLSGYLLLKYSLSKSKRNYYNIIIIIYYLLLIIYLVTVLAISIEIVRRITEVINFNIDFLNYDTVLSVIILFSSIITIFLFPVEMRNEMEIIKKITFINKQCTLIITILAIFSIKLSQETIHSRLLMVCLFSIYPLSLMYNFFELLSDEENKENKK